MKRILHLTLTAKWFEMIAKGIKLEEYRQIKKHWINILRLSGCVGLTAETVLNNPKIPFWKDYDVIEFRNGYGSNVPTMQVEFKGIEIGVGRQSWGAKPLEKYFVIKLGKVLSIKNYDFQAS